MHPFGSGEKPPSSNADDFEIPGIVRNQGLRLGAEIGGKALSHSGTALIGYGVAQRRHPIRPRRYESVTKKQVRSKGGRVQKGTTYLPGNSRAQSRQLHRTRYNRPSPRGSNTIRSGVALRGAGRALPILAVGYIGYDLSRGKTPETDMDLVRSFGDPKSGRARRDSLTNLGKQQRDLFNSELVKTVFTVSAGVDIVRGLLS